MIEGENFSMEHVKSGAPQSSVPGPLPFLVFINDVLDGMSVTTRLFADDCILYTEVKNKDDQIRLNNCLRLVKEWPV